MKAIRDFYVRPHRVDARLDATYKYVKESNIVTELSGNILSLDLANDSNAREFAFSYAVSITPPRPELANRIFTSIKMNEKRSNK